MKKVMILLLAIFMIGVTKTFAQSGIGAKLHKGEVILCVDGKYFTESRDSLLSLYKKGYIVLEQWENQRFVKLIQLSFDRAATQLVFKEEEAVGIFMQQVDGHYKGKWLLQMVYCEDVPKELQFQPMVVK